MTVGRTKRGRNAKRREQRAHRAHHLFQSPPEIDRQADRQADRQTGYVHQRGVQARAGSLSSWCLSPAAAHRRGRLDASVVTGSIDGLHDWSS